MSYQKVLFGALVFVSSILFTGCAEMYSAMSNYNEMNGAQCYSKAIDFAGYSKELIL